MLKLILFVKEPSDLYRFAVEMSSNASKFYSQQTQRKACLNKKLVELCKKVLQLTDDNFKNYKYLLNQNIDLCLK